MGGWRLRWAYGVVVDGPFVHTYAWLTHVFVRVKTASGMTIVSRAVLEHNVGAVARIYASIRFEDLAKLLETDGTSAQGIAAKMCNSGVISATIDQVDGVLYFTEAVDGKSELKNDWNAAVRGFCVNMNECADKAKAAMEGAADMKQ